MDAIDDDVLFRIHHLGMDIVEELSFWLIVLLLRTTNDGEKRFLGIYTVAVFAFSVSICFVDLLLVWLRHHSLIDFIHFLLIHDSILNSIVIKKYDEWGIVCLSFTFTFFNLWQFVFSSFVHSQNLKVKDFWRVLIINVHVIDNCPLKSLQLPVKYGFYSSSCRFSIAYRI